MSAFVLDCSIAMTWCFDDEAHASTDALLDSLRNDGAFVPALWFWEVANVLNGAMRRGRLSGADVATRLALLSQLPIVIDDEGAARAWREALLLAQAEHLTAYDSAYLELAMRMGIALATKDVELRDAAMRRGVPLLPQSLQTSER